MRAARITRQIEIDERALTPSLRQFPEQFLDIFLRRRRGALPIFDSQQLLDLSDMRAVGIAFEIEMQKVGVPLSAGKLPEQGLGRFARSFARRKIKLPGERRILPGNLRAARRCDNVFAHLDHHAGYVFADGGEMSEQRLRKRTVAGRRRRTRHYRAASRKRSESPPRCRRAPDPGDCAEPGTSFSGLVRQASRKIRWMPLPCSCILSTSSKCTV